MATRRYVDERFHSVWLSIERQKQELDLIKTHLGIEIKDVSERLILVKLCPKCKHDPALKPANLLTTGYGIPGLTAIFYCDCNCHNSTPDMPTDQCKCKPSRKGKNKR